MTDDLSKKNLTWYKKRINPNEPYYKERVDLIEDENFQIYREYWLKLDPNIKKSISKRFHGMSNAIQTAAILRYSIRRPTIHQVRSLSVDDIPYNEKGIPDGSSYETVTLMVLLGLIRSSDRNT